MLTWQLLSSQVKDESLAFWDIDQPRVLTLDLC
ncbi:hypothetical protein CYPRO_2859 [Cyclonatronum proteinivorum]|uniref:Uncharacterized protein n=1 Tax=Cyclonatronum proteinivorum TaxID=1457365 RepID=A0A345UNP5_9BACT|nr:hypothetical protein CYPRO_2859 [Cyclonatronum proteinivorum]